MRPRDEPTPEDILAAIIRVQREMRDRPGSITIHFTEGRARKIEVKFFEDLDRPRPRGGP